MKEKESVEHSAKVYTSKNRFYSMRENPWILSSIILAVVLILIVIFGKSIFGGSSADVSIVTPEVASSNLVKFMNNLAKEANVSVESTVREGGLYKVNVNYNSQKVPIYVTLDGTKAIANPQALIPLNETLKPSQTQPSEEETPQEIPKTDKPKVELFVWSFCPGGTYGESVIKPTVDLLKDKIDAKVRYIGPVTTDKQEAASSCFARRGKSADDAAKECCIAYNYTGKTYYSCALHNSKDNLLESYESERQVCILNKSGQVKLSAYLEEFNANCIAKRGDAAAFNACATQAMQKFGINAQTINTCVESKEGLKLLIQDYEYSVSLGGIHASPSYFVNGVQVSPKSADSFKQSVCNAFSTAPSECSQTVQVSGSAVDNSGVSCG